MRSRLALLGALALLLAAPREARPQAAEPPLHISADNVTGTRAPEGDVVHLNGNVRIVRGRTVITSQTGRYIRARGLLHLEGRVELVDSTTTMTCDRATYSEVQDVLELEGNVRVVDGDAVLTAPRATYDRRKGRAELVGGVEARDRRQRMRAERAVYFRDTRLLQARGKVRGFDEENRLELDAASVDYDRDSSVAIATGDPELRSRDDGEKVTVIRAIRLRLDTDTRVAEAFDSVRVTRDTLQARSDYARFDDRANRGLLLGHPRAWDDETQVSGDTLETWTDGKRLERVVVRGNATMDYTGRRPDSEGETSRLTGSRVDVHFTDEEIDSLVAVGAARNEYRGAPKEGKTAEQNLAQGDTITVFFEDRKIDRARVEGNASGTYSFGVDVADTAAARREVVDYAAPRIEFQLTDHEIILENGAKLDYGDMGLTARRVVFDSELQTLVAEGNPELVQSGDKVTGRVMAYDLETKVGTIAEATTSYEAGLYHGEQIRKVGDNELHVKNGTYSTCSLAEPHYHFGSRWMKIFLKDKLVAKPVVFYVKRVPLLALPFWVFPIKPGRHSGFLFPQFEFGFASGAGQFVRNAGYYWAPNDYADFTFSGDYYQAEPSWVLRFESLYKLLYVLEGEVYATFARNEGQQAEEWELEANHEQELSPRTRLVGSASFISSRDYSSTNIYGRPLSQRLNRFLTSRAAVSHQADWASINAALERREDLDAELDLEDPDGIGPERGGEVGTMASLPSLTALAPSVSVSFPTRAIGSLPFLRRSPLQKSLGSTYFGMTSQFVSEYERRAFVSGEQVLDTEGTIDSVLTTVGQARTTRRGFQSNSSLTDTRRLFGWLNLQPGVSGTVAVFDFDELGNRVVPTGTWSSFVRGSATYYRTMRPSFGPLVGLRHVVVPSVRFTYSPEFRHLIFEDSLGTRRARFRGFSGIGVSGFEQSRMDLGLEQRFQLKLKGKNEEVRRLDNFLTWNSSSSYNFRWREEGQRHPLGLVRSSLFLQPPGFVSATANWVTDVYSRRPLRSLTYNLGFNLSSTQIPAAPRLPAEEQDWRLQGLVDEEYRAPWTVGLTYSYAGGYPGRRWSSNQVANAVANVKLTPNWTLDWSAAYDITNRQMATQRFALSRELHCWRATFVRTFTASGEAEFYFRLGVKDQQEIFIERGTRAGSIGGIQ